MDAPNPSQIAGQLRLALAAGGPLAAVILKKTGWAAGDYELYLELFLYVVPPIIAAVWSWIGRSAGRVLSDASKIEGATVVVDPKVASSSVLKAVANEKLPDVQTEFQFLQNKGVKP